MIGVWALLAPQSFYDNFPGLGRQWISADGPYNEHLLRDFGALNLALATVLIYAAVSLARPVINAAAMAAMVWGVPHVLYHTFNTDPFGAGDNFFSIGGLLVFAALPIAIMVIAGKLDDEQPSVVQSATSTLRQ